MISLRMPAFFMATMTTGHMGEELLLISLSMSASLPMRASRSTSSMRTRGMILLCRREKDLSMMMARATTEHARSGHMTGPPLMKNSQSVIDPLCAPPFGIFAPLIP